MSDDFKRSDENLNSSSRIEWSEWTTINPKKAKEDTRPNGTVFNKVTKKNIKSVASTTAEKTIELTEKTIELTEAFYKAAKIQYENWKNRNDDSRSGNKAGPGWCQALVEPNGKELTDLGLVLVSRDMATVDPDTVDFNDLDMVKRNDTADPTLDGSREDNFYRGKLCNKPTTLQISTNCERANLCAFEFCNEHMCPSCRASDLVIDCSLPDPEESIVA